MFKKKYTPSAKSNNGIKESIVSKIKAMIFGFEKSMGKIGIEPSVMKSAIENINSELSILENSIGTGKEDFSTLPDKIAKEIENVKKQSEQNLVNRFDKAVDELCCSINTLSALISGEINVLDNNQDIEQNKVTWARKKLNARLVELLDIKSALQQNEKRLEKEILAYENDLLELDEMMLTEDNERKINDLYRKISSTKSKLEMISSHRSNYSACYNLLDIIYENASEIIRAGEFSIEELGKAKVLLDISKLKEVLSDPEKVISILNIMKDGIKKISEKTANIDNKVFGINAGETKVSDSALAYKEELMRKKREKITLEEVKSHLENATNIVSNNSPSKTEVE